MHNPLMTPLRKPRNTDWAHLILRLGVAFVFMAHGWMKFQDLEMTARFFGKLGIPVPGTMAVFIAIVEFVGGAFLLPGLATRLVSFLQASTMVVAILTAFGLARIADAEIELLLLSASISLLLTGAGAYSLDARLIRKGIGEHDASMPMPVPKA